MCGICGFYSKNQESIENLIKMNNTMIHRGPNDHGEEIYVGQDTKYGIGLAQRRLSIIDLSSNGHQPMHSPRGRISLVFNGEIYNYKELRAELYTYPFQSNCDTEVIIAAYLKWGIKCVDKFNGMFAIAIYDREDDTLYLVRDRIGKKPLYYYLKDGNLYFASELKPLMANPYFARKINERIISKYLYRQYINAPDSIFENTYKLEPGGILKFTKGKVEKWKYWDVADIYKANHTILTYEEALDEFEVLMKDAVQKRMVADVSVGEFLSGGYDSALICALAQSMSEKPIKTYSIGFEDEKLNEAPFAKQIAKYLGTGHTEYYISEKKMFELVMSIPKYYDEPFADSSQICTMLVSELAKKDVTVVLTGDAGDEFFGGYIIYDRLLNAQKMKGRGILLHNLYKIPGVNKIKDFRTLPLSLKIAAESMNQKIKTQSGTGYYFGTLNNLLLCEDQTCCLDPIEERYGEHNWVYRRMLTDMDTYLPGDILCKVDRASMKYSLEARCPFLDKNVMEFSLGLPLEYKIRNGNLKSMIKDLVYKYIPKELMDRPKQGFAVPIEKWLRNELKDELLSYVDREYLMKQNIFKANETRKFVYDFVENGDGGKNTGKNYAGFVWSYYIFQKWYEYYMEN
ncbi:MAG: asparagine synthase (glutamine-hydrolyzing) [Roseburia sp.]